MTDLAGSKEHRLNSGPEGAARATLPQPKAPVSRQVVESLRWEMEELGLGTYEARVLIGLFQLGQATPGRIARVAGIPRTSTYQVLEELRLKDLVARVPGSGPAVWAARRHDDVLDRLDAAQEEVLRQQKARTATLRQSMPAMFPAPAPPAVPPFQILDDASRIRSSCEKLAARANSEMLIYNELPFSGRDEPGPSKVVLAAAKRVRVRAVYEERQGHDPLDGQWRASVEAYHAAGVEGRVVEKLPLKLVVIDRTQAIVCVEDPVLPGANFPAVLLVDHVGVAETLANSFDYCWERARPFPA